ncbi:hypothetical protein J6590_051279 [Homalodisca vitripennis]|nr:hypothetical protein J6590_051279 [Homalodisca vitripennis]
MHAKLFNNGDTDAGIVHHSRADRPIILLHPPFTILLLIGRHILVLHPILRYACKVVQQRRHGRGHRSSFTGRPSYHSTSPSIYNSAAHRQAYPGTSLFYGIHASCTTETRTRASFIIHGQTVYHSTSPQQPHSRQTVLSFYFTSIYNSAAHRQAYPGTSLYSTAGISWYFTLFYGIHAKLYNNGDTDAGIVHHSRADRPIILLHPPFTILLLIGRHILVLHPILRYTCKVVQQRRHGRGHRSSFTGRPSYHSTSPSIYNSAAHRQAYPGTSPYSTAGISWYFTLFYGIHAKLYNNGDTDAGIVHHSRAHRPIILLHPPVTILLLIGRHILVLHPILRYTCKVVQQRRHGRGHRSSFTGRPSYHSTSPSIYNSAAHRQAYPGTSPYSTVYMQSCTTTETRTRASFIIHGQTVLSFYFTLFYGIHAKCF